MSNKKILITGAVLGAALVALLEKAKGSDVESDIVLFQGQLNDFLAQPAPLDQSELVIELRKQVDELKDELKAQGDEANGIVEQLKLELKEAKEKGALLADKPTVEVDGVTYIINHAAYPHSVEDIKANEDIARKIIRINGQQALTEA